jgi:hypothetical protein
MWNYTIFLPAAALLALLAVLQASEHSMRSPVRVAALAIAFWLLSWFAVVAVVYARSADTLSSSFVPQRELGYWSGSALFMAVPFLAVFAAGHALSRTRLSYRSRRYMALVVAAGAWVFTPGLFFAGWVMGCLAFGYRSCM